MKKIFSAIVILGLGSFAMAQQKPSVEDMQTKRVEMQQKMKQKQEEKMQEMQKTLNLTPDQVAKIKAMHEKRKAESQQDFQKKKADREVMMNQMKEKKAEMEAQMKSILTPEQYAKWQADREAKMKDRKAKFSDKKGFPMGKKITRGEVSATTSVR